MTLAKATAPLEPTEIQLCTKTFRIILRIFVYWIVLTVKTRNNGIVGTDILAKAYEKNIKVALTAQ